jgi:hypothetical protein
MAITKERFLHCAIWRGIRPLARLDQEQESGGGVGEAGGRGQKTCGLLNWKFSGLLALENAASVDACYTEVID